MIGVFDSGAGGLTVLSALRRRMPSHHFVYVGDTARAPYGRKPAVMVAEFAAQVTDYLCSLGAEGIVVACNTASALALRSVRAKCPVPVWGMVDAGVEAATRATTAGRVGVIATQATVASGAYQRRLADRGIAAWAQACPMLVHLVEEGLAESREADLMVRHYLSGMPPIDTLLLGCTHYPLLRGSLQRAVGARVQLVDGAEITADSVAAAFPPVAGGRAAVTYLVTGDPSAFHHTAAQVGGRDGTLHHLPVGKLRSTAPLAA
jgi:glutamate racemase